MKACIIFPSRIHKIGNLTSVHNATQGRLIVAHVYYDDLIPNCNGKDGRSPDARMYIRSALSPKNIQTIKEIIARKLEISIDEIKQGVYDRPEIWSAFMIPDVTLQLENYFFFQLPLHLECEIDD